MQEDVTVLIQATAIAIENRALLLEGPPGSGKSSLALSLMDRGAELIGDDGVTLTQEGDTVTANPPPNTEGLLEIRGVGLIRFPTRAGVPVALILSIVEPGHAERLPGMLIDREFFGIGIPVLPFVPGTKCPALRAEWALRRFGLNSG